MKRVLQLLCFLATVCVADSIRGMDAQNPLPEKLTIVFNNHSCDTNIWVNNGVQLPPHRKDFTAAGVTSVAVRTIAGKLLIAWKYQELLKTKSITVTDVESHDRHIIIQEFNDASTTEFITE